MRVVFGLGVSAPYLPPSENSTHRGDVYHLATLVLLLHKLKTRIDEHKRPLDPQRSSCFLPKQLYFLF